jgi:hypothetical protein
MIDDVKIGELKTAFKLLKSTNSVAKLVGLDPRTVAKYKRLKLKLPKRAPAKPSKMISQRRKQLLAWTKLFETKSSRTWPRFATARALREKLQLTTGLVVSARTIQRDLRAVGLKNYVRRKVPTRSAPDARKRAEFAKAMKRWPARDIKRIVFSDESWLTTNEHTSRTQWAERKSQVLPRERKCRWNVCSVMIWGAVGHQYKSKLVVLPAKQTKDGEVKSFRLDAGSYIRRCLGTVSNDLVQKHRIFQQDGARSHVAQRVVSYMKKKKLSLLQNWPPYSPDWNPIERIWHELQKRVGARCPTTTEELTVIANEEWERLDQKMIDRHVHHFETQMKNFGKEGQK